MRVLAQRCVVTLSRESRLQSTLALDKVKLANEVKSARFKQFTEIPSAEGLPFIGTLLEYIRGPFQISKLHEAHSHRVKTLGPIYRERLGPGPEMLFLSSSEDAALVYQAEAKQKCPRRPGMWAQDAYNKLRGCPGGVVSDHGGQDWENTWRMRKGIQKKMLRPQEVNKYLPHMSDLTDDFVEILQEEAKKNGGGVKDIQKWIYRWSLEAGAGVVFDQRLHCMEGNLRDDSNASKLIQSAQGFFECLIQLEIGSPHHRFKMSSVWKKFVEVNDELYSTGKKMLEVDSKQISEASFLAWLKKAEELTEEEKAVIGVQVLGAAIDTTSNAAVLNLYQLAKHPNIQEEVARELTLALSDPSQQLTTKHLDNLPLLKACITETFRLTPIVSGISRILDHEIVLSGYKVPAGTPIMMLFGAMGEKEEYFKNPQEFNPHRFLGKNKEASAYKVMPFGHGVRMCLGRRVATMELQVLLARLIRRNKLTYLGEEEVGLTFRLINTPDRPVHLGLEERS